MGPVAKYFTIKYYSTTNHAGKSTAIPQNSYQKTAEV